MMIRKFLLAMLLVPFITLAQESYVIKGKIGTVSSPAKLYLTYNADGQQRADSVDLKNGVFSFSGKTGTVEQAALVLDYDGKGFRSLSRESNFDVLQVYLAPGTTLVNSADSLSKAKVTGTKPNEEAQQFSVLLKEVNRKITSLNEEYRNAAPEKKTSEEFIKNLQSRYEGLKKERDEVIKSFISKHPDSFVSLYALKSMAASDPDAADLLPMFNLLSKNVKSSKAAMALQVTLEAGRKTAIGATAMDFTQNDTSGKPVKLSDFRGKYVLIDFWASWCGPCRQENPNVVKAFNAYKDKNFTVLGVSLDRENGRDAWLKAIKNDNLTWTQVSDLKFWQNEAAVQYGVRSIPQNFLINPEGKIIAKNLRGEELHSFLANVLK